VTTHPPEIATPALRLRAFVPGDAAKMYRMSREQGMSRWIPDQVYADAAQARQVLLALIDALREPATPTRGPYVLGICLAATQELIGHVGLSPWRGEVEIGFAIEDAHQRRGHATAAVRAMARWALPAFGLERILGIVADENLASCRVLEGAGFALVERGPGTMHGRSRLVRTYALAAQ
jgi:RimJ/RimL family protein N-acetyltransferase